MTDRTLQCRSCGSTRLRPFLDLGSTPLADALVRPEAVGTGDPRYPLEVAFCEDCTLVQITEEVPPQTLFVDNYLYFSSFSDHLLRHSRDHALRLIDDRGLSSSSLVVEIASNDGYLLKTFVEKGIDVIGIDPAPDQARAANESGVRTIAEFFGPELAERLAADQQADVIIANNVMAHVPDVNGFVSGMRTLLAPGGVITVENPTVGDLLAKCEFDTIYHEHFCYYSCHSVANLVERNGLHLNDVEYFPDLHGGTLRWHISHEPGRSDRLSARMADEEAQGLTTFAAYRELGDRVESLRLSLRNMLESYRAAGRRVVGYGAAAKGSTLLNYVGIGADLVDVVVDRNVHKQGLHMPGTHQRIEDPALLVREQPDAVLLLAWNFASEIADQQREYLERGGAFIVPVPEPHILESHGAELAPR